MQIHVVTIFKSIGSEQWLQAVMNTKSAEEYGIQLIPETTLVHAVEAAEPVR